MVYLILQINKNIHTGVVSEHCEGDQWIFGIGACFLARKRPCIGWNRVAFYVPCPSHATVDGGVRFQDPLVNLTAKRLAIIKISFRN